MIFYGVIFMVKKKSIGKGQGKWQKIHDKTKKKSSMGEEIPENGRSVGTTF